MNETSSTLQNFSASNREKLHAAVVRTANLSPVPSISDSTLHYAGRTLSHKSDVLLTLSIGDSDSLTLTVNCEKIVIGSMLIKDLKLPLMS